MVFVKTHHVDASLIPTRRSIFTLRDEFTAGRADGCTSLTKHRSDAEVLGIATASRSEMAKMYGEDNVRGTCIVVASFIVRYGA